MNKRVLCVDDDPSVLAAYRRNFRNTFEVDVAADAAEALAKVRSQVPFAVVVTDMRMPGMNGAELLAQLRHTAPDTVRLMLTGNADQRTAIDAVNQGHVFRFLTKPCSVEDLSAAVQAGIEQHRLITAERDLLENTLNGAVKALTEILAVLDPDAFARGERLRTAVHEYLAHFNISQPWTMELASMLATIGYVAVPPVVQLKARSGLTLQPKEAEMLERVPQTGADLLARIPRLEPVARIILHQHKHYDGSGFPANGIAGEDIPIGARILKVLADFLALTDAGASRAGAIQEMNSRPGWYDPRVLDSVAVCFDVAPPVASEAGARELEVPLADLAVGDRFLDPLRNSDGDMLHPAGTCVTPAALQRILNCSQLQPVVEPIRVLRRLG